jgi:hypothetical protein
MPARAVADGAQADPVTPPVYAYYYIWFTPSSWERAKIDYPLLGRYSSDERRVMARHVAWAKASGITGFIVSWKGTPTLNRRLERLMRIADRQHFKLAIIYEGLDFDREPLPIAQVATDMRLFARRYASDPAFDGFGRKPLVIWSGTWRFTPRQIASVTVPLRKRLLILASEHHPDTYESIARLVDGNAYYWSSVNPQTYPGYPEKLAAFGEAVHAHGGMWIAPAATGFDARLIGGTTVVSRRDGATLRAELDAATRSSPDAIGLISWNEFSENSHIEPSERFGARYLDVLADALGAPPPSLPDFDSDAAAAGSPTRYSYAMPLLTAMALLVLAGVFAVAWRRSRLTGPERPTR